MLDHPHTPLALPLYPLLGDVVNVGDQIVALGFVRVKELLPSACVEYLRVHAKATAPEDG